MEDPDAYGYGTHLDFNKAYDWNQNNWKVIKEFEKLRIQELKAAQEEIKRKKAEGLEGVVEGDYFNYLDLKYGATVAGEFGKGLFTNILPAVGEAVEYMLTPDGKMFGMVYSDKLQATEFKNLRRRSNLEKLDPDNVKYLYTEGQQVKLFEPSN